MSIKPIPAAALGVLLLGLVFHIVGLATPAWGVVKLLSIEQEFGLWKQCVDDTCSSYNEKPDWLKSSQATAIIGFIAALAATGVAGAIIYFNYTDSPCPQLVKIAALVAAGTAAGFILITNIVTIAEMQDDLSAIDPGYSWALSFVAAILMLVGGGLAFYGACSS